MNILKQKLKKFNQLLNYLVTFFAIINKTKSIIWEFGCGINFGLHLELIWQNKKSEKFLALGW